MARATPMARVLSKNTVSPSAMAVTIDSPSKSHALAEIVVKAPVPAVASTQTTRSTPPIVERIALMPTEPSSDMRERARRLVTAHATAEPRAARAPNVVSSITSGSYPLDNPGGARRRSYTVRFLVYGAVFALAFVAFSLVSFWLAVRPPRLAIPQAPGDYGLKVETVTISADDGVRLAAWLLPRAGAPALVLLHGYPAEKAVLLPRHHHGLARARRGCTLGSGAAGGESPGRADSVRPRRTAAARARPRLAERGRVHGSGPARRAAPRVRGEPHAIFPVICEVTLFALQAVAGLG